jgi:hypothetical protein
VKEAPAEVVMIEAEKDNKAVLIPIALSVVLVVVLAICVRQLMNRSDKEQLKEAENRVMKIKNMNEQELSDCKPNVIDLGSLDKQNDYDQVNRDSNVNTFEVSIKAGLDEYATQYDPNNDFAVFGVGDKTRGGVMSMKEKMNLADIVDDVQEEDSDDHSPVA